MPQSQDTALNHILSSAQLPTLPAMAMQLLELTSREDASIADIVNCITHDIALSAKILKVANSSFYNFRQKITSINQAVVLLGINAVRSLVLNFTFLSLGKQSANNRFNLRTFWERSLAGATAAKMLAAHTHGIDPDNLFTIGLLQNVGQLIFALLAPDRYDSILERLTVSDRNADETTLEEEMFAISHAALGAEVAKIWGLPSAILEAIRHHHDPDAYAGGDPHEQAIVDIVFLSGLVADILYARDPEGQHRKFHEEAERRLGLDDLARNSLLAVIHSEINQTARFFEVPVNAVRPVSEILHEANIRLSMLQLSYEEIHRELIRAKLELESVRRRLLEKNLLLEQLANIDSLTEVCNHRYFQTFLHSEINRTISNHGCLSLILADIDHFKRFNDTYGHQSGDFILKELCQVAKNAIRQYDLIARYGGEEFAFVLPELEGDSAMVVANRLCQTIADHDFFDGYRHYHVTLSLGVACARPDAGFKQTGFIDQADRALYRAKTLGRNQAILYQPSSLQAA